MAKYKLLFVDHLPFVGGAQLALSRHLKHLNRGNFSAVLAGSDNAPQLAKDFEPLVEKLYRLPFTRLKIFNPLSLWNYLMTSFELIRIVRRENCALIVTNTERAFYPSLLAAKLTGRKVVVLIRDYEYPRALLKRLRPLTACFVFVSLNLRDYYMGGDTSKSRVIYVGTDINKPSAGASEADVRFKIRQRWGVDDSQVVIGFAGRLVAWKGAALLIEACRLLKADKALTPESWKVRLAGTGTGQDGNNENQIIRQIKEGNLTEEVELLGFIDKMSDYYAGLDIFVHPSLKPEPFATVVVEAMSLGLPVVASRAGGTPEIITDGENGFLFKPGSAEELSDYLKKLIKDPTLRLRLGQTARTRAARDFTEENITNELQKLYLEILNR